MMSGPVQVGFHWRRNCFPLLVREMPGLKKLYHPECLNDWALYERSLRLACVRVSCSRSTHNGCDTTSPFSGQATNYSHSLHNRRRAHCAAFLPAPPPLSWKMPLIRCCRNISKALMSGFVKAARGRSRATWEALTRWRTRICARKWPCFLLKRKTGNAPKNQKTFALLRAPRPAWTPVGPCTHAHTPFQLHPRSASARATSA